LHHLQSEQQSSRRELPIGDVIQAAIAAGLPVEAEVFPEGSYLDVGTPDDLKRAVQRFTQ
jgi:glucose-1-phosphate thymidylyltransferase